MCLQLLSRQTRVLDVCPFQIRYFARITCWKILVDNFIIGAKVWFPEIVNRQNSGMSLSSQYKNIVYTY